MNKPDFLCIGAQKSGTTWLYENLARHKEIWATPIKELHYFNRICPNERLLGKWSPPIPSRPAMYFNAILNGSYSNLRWLHRYYDLSLEKAWYTSLFDSSFTRGRLCGDITPGYATLDKRGVEYCQRVIGTDTPIILILRNPIERAWSAIKMISRYNNINAKQHDLEYIKNILNEERIQLASDYSSIIPLWQSSFSNLNILFYDELCEAPENLLSRVSRILDIENQWDQKTMNTVVWSDPKKIFRPKEVDRLLNEQYRDEIIDTIKLTDSHYPSLWLK
jgi:hypothetical protein